MNDLLMASDHGCMSFLALPDPTAAFNTMGHNILLDWLEISGWH